MDLPCCQDDNLLSCHQVDLDVNSLGDQDLELAPLNTTVQYKGLVQGSKNSYHYENDLVDLVLTVHNGDIYGHMALDNGDSYTVEYCGDGIHVMKQLDVENLGEDNGEEDELDEEFAFQRALTPEDRKDNTTIVTFTVKVYYTPSFAAVTADIEGFVEQVIQETNQGYINSNIPLRVAAICIEAATIDDMHLSTDNDMLNAFTRMKGNVQALRGSADAAALLVKSMVGCGIGRTNSIASGNTLSVTRKDCALGYYSFGHELGHNIGLKHNREVQTNPYYPDGYGYLIPKGSHSTGLRTILAYSAEGHRTRVNYYSNPNVIHPTTGTPTGVAGVADSARIITMNRFALAAVGDESQCESYPLDKECYIENISFREYQKTHAYYRGYTKESCQSACEANSTCFEYYFGYLYGKHACVFRNFDIRQPGQELSGWAYVRRATVPNVLNPKCTIIKDCSKPGRMYSSGLYTLVVPRPVTASAKDCHLECLKYSKCKYWVWEDNGYCNLKAENFGGFHQYWTTNFRSCGV